jgi:hypothetical protein
MVGALAALCGAIGFDNQTTSGAVRFVKQQKLPDGQMAVVAEGDFEPRSIGSYSVRLYLGRMPKFPFDDFCMGLVGKRDGTLEKLLVEDIDGDKKAELIVTIRNAGSGSYLSADAYTIDKRKFSLRASVKGLQPTADPVAELKKKIKK